MPDRAESSKSLGDSFDSLLRSVEKDDFLLYFTALLGIVMPGCVYFLYHYIHSIYLDYAKKRVRKRSEEKRERSAVTIFYCSEGGRSAALANLLAERLHYEAPPVIDLASVDPNVFSSFKGIGLFIVSSAAKGREPENVEWFFDWLEDIAVEKSSKKRKARDCSKMHFAIFGIGDSKYGPTRFNRAAKTLTKRLLAIGASPLLPLVLADQSKISSLEEQTDEWADHVLEAVDDFCSREDPDVPEKRRLLVSSSDSLSDDSEDGYYCFSNLIYGENRDDFSQDLHERPSERSCYESREGLVAFDGPSDRSLRHRDLDKFTSD